MSVGSALTSLIMFASSGGGVLELLPYSLDIFIQTAARLRHSTMRVVHFEEGIVPNHRCSKSMFYGSLTTDAEWSAG